MISVAEEAFKGTGMSSLRVIRGLKMFRVLRVIRIVRFFRDLRMMVISILQSLGSLSWALCLLLIIMYLFAVIFMQGAVMHLHIEGENLDPNDVVLEGVVAWYSSLFDTMYTLLAAITGGLDWTDAVTSLDSISTVYRCLWTFYIVFVVIGVLNVLTGIFVERACELSFLDKDFVVQAELKRNEVFLVEMKNIFDEANANCSGTLTWHEFKAYLESPQVQAYFRTKQLNSFDARLFFDTLKEGGTDELDLEAFLVGCQRLQGQARSVDLHAVLMECRENRRDLKSLIRRLDDVVLTDIRAPACQPHWLQSNLPKKTSTMPLIQ
jgi:hypothetical protein